jgi:hypothetical protein
LIEVVTLVPKFEEQLAEELRVLNAQSDGTPGEIRPNTRTDDLSRPLSGKKAVGSSNGVQPFAVFEGKSKRKRTRELVVSRHALSFPG